MNKRLLPFAFLLACSLGCSAQAASSGDIDTLLQQADFVRTSDPDAFRRFLDRLDRLSGEATDGQRMQLRLLHAYRLMIDGELEAAVSGLKRLLDESEDTELRYRAGGFLVNTYALTRDFTSGLMVLEETLALAGRVEDEEIRSNGFLSATVLYNQIGQYGLGQHYVEMVLAMNPKGRAHCFAENLRIEALQGQGKAPGDSVFQAAVDRCNEIGEPIGTNLVRSYFAKKLYSEGRVVEALDILEGSLDEVRETHYKHLIGEFHALISKYRLKLGELSVAEEQANAAISQSEGFLHTMPLVTAYWTLFSVAEERGDVRHALDLHKKYAEVDKAYLNEAKARELAFQIVRHETLQKNQQIEILAQRNQVLELQQQIAQQSSVNSKLVLLLLLCVFFFLMYWVYKNKRLQVHLRRMTEVDTLTGICSRHHFSEKAEKALEQSARNSEDVSLVMFDLDHFKQINDRFGHAAGDWALKQVAAAYVSICRPTDCFGRLGGEEFAILLPGCDAPVAKRVSEEAMMRFAAIDAASNGYDFRLTASFGVADSKLSGHDLTRLLSHADKALYRAKRAGRNRVCVFEEENVTTFPMPAEQADADAASSVEVEPNGEGRRSAVVS